MRIQVDGKKFPIIHRLVWTYANRVRDEAFHKIGIEGVIEERLVDNETEQQLELLKMVSEFYIPGKSSELKELLYSSSQPNTY